MTSFCGCCGNWTAEGEMWCQRCAKHVLHNREPWESTWFAQTQKACPFAEPGAGL